MKDQHTENPLGSLILCYFDMIRAVCAGTVGDVENARLVYKNAVANEEVYRLPEIWEYFLDFEASYGTVQEMLTVEGQRRAALPAVAGQPLDSVHAMRTRYTMLDLWPCTTAQRRHIEDLQGHSKSGKNSKSCVLHVG